VPFLYYDDIQNGAGMACANHVRDYATDFTKDLNAGTYKYMWITPNLNDDGHDPQNDPPTGLKQTDAFLKGLIPVITGSAAYMNNGVIFITWDEAEGRNGDDPDQIPMIILSPRIKAAGYTSAKAYTHLNFLATVEDILNAGRLPTTMGKANMMEFFK
jgi:hypothetical protein